MKRLSQTWKQKKSVNSKPTPSTKFAFGHQLQHEKSKHVFAGPSIANTTKPGPTTESTKTRKQDCDHETLLTSPSNSINLSFGFDFDAAALSEMDQLEQRHVPSPTTTPIPHKQRLTERNVPSVPHALTSCQSNPNTPKSSLCPTQKKTLKINKKISIGIDISTTKLNTPKSTNHYQAQKQTLTGRERISTPIEDSGHILVSPTANLPVFSPVNWLSNASVSESLQLGDRQRIDNGEKSCGNSTSGSTKSKNSNSSGSSNTSSVLEVCPGSGSDVLNLASWGLPSSVLQQYNDMGITHMFEWQAECLRTGNVLKGGNLVYSAPTSAGKTMVAELLMLKRVLETKRKALLILPYVSLAREKMFYLQRVFQEAGIRVEGFMGSHNPAGGFAAVDIAVCTIEKANSLMNRLLEENKVSTVGVVVVDEMHMLGDPHRGYLLELFLTKIRFVTGQEGVQTGQNEEGKNATEPSIQVVCMSATLPNLDMLARWLDADLYHTNHRPVPLTEMVKVGPTIYDTNMKKIRDIDVTTAVANDDDHVIPLCKETISAGHSVLIFCPTKNWCEKQAEAIARHFSSIGNAALARKGHPSSHKMGFVKASDLIAFDYEGIREVFEQLKRTPVGLDSVLKRVLPYSVAYHHAGLTMDERDIIEGGFRQGAIKVLVATSTLCSGVNLPARRVIIRTPTFHGKMVDPLVYKQMAGRAGRKGVDDLGESILVCKMTERHKATTLMKSDLKPVQSCLLLKELNGGIKRALLEVIASGVVTGLRDVERYAACTFFASSSRESDFDGSKCAIPDTIKFLVDNEFIRVQVTKDKKSDDGKESEESSDEKYVPTQLGAATVASALSPDEALVVFGDLQQARKCFVLESELHIIYQVTPIYVETQWPNLDWNQFLIIWERLPSHMRRVADIVGIQEVYLSLASRGRIPTRTPQQRQQLRVHRRFFAALALQDLVHEVPLNVVARRYGATRGMIQSLQSSASTFAGMVSVFCQKLGWVNLDLLLSQFQSRLSFGVERELCDLVRISVLNAARARMLYNAGYQTIASLASAKPEDIETVLRNAVPFISERKHQGETDLEVRHRSEARVFWVAGKRGLSEREAAVLIVNEAKQHLQNDVAQLGIQWRAPEVKVPEVPLLEVPIPGTSTGSKRHQSSHVVNHLSRDKDSTGKKRRYLNRRGLSGNYRNRKSPPLRRSPRNSNQDPSVNRAKDDINPVSSVTCTRSSNQDPSVNRAKDDINPVPSVTCTRSSNQDPSVNRAKDDIHPVPSVTCTRSSNQDPSVNRAKDDINPVPSVTCTRSSNQDPSVNRAKDNINPVPSVTCTTMRDVEKASFLINKEQDRPDSAYVKSTNVPDSKGQKPNAILTCRDENKSNATEIKMVSEVGPSNKMHGQDGTFQNDGKRTEPPQNVVLTDKMVGSGITNNAKIKQSLLREYYTETAKMLKNKDPTSVDTNREKLIKKIDPYHINYVTTSKDSNSNLTLQNIPNISCNPTITRPENDKKVIANNHGHNPVNLGPRDIGSTNRITDCVMTDQTENSLKRIGDFFDDGKQKRSEEEEKQDDKVELGKKQRNASTEANTCLNSANNSSTPKMEIPVAKRSSPRNSIPCDGSASIAQPTNKRRSPRSRQSDSPKEKVPRREISAHDIQTTSPDSKFEKQDSVLNTTQSFSAQEESCSSAILFDNTIDTSENRLAPGPNISPELYSEPLNEESIHAQSNEGDGKVFESQDIGFSMSDSYLAQCGGLTQLNPVEHHSQQQEFEVISSISDDMIAKQVNPEEHHSQQQEFEVISSISDDMIAKQVNLDEHHSQQQEFEGISSISDDMISKQVNPEEHHSQQQEFEVISSISDDMISKQVNPEEHHSQQQEFEGISSISDDMIAKQVNHEEHHSQQQEFEGILSISDDMIAKHCDIILQEMECQENGEQKSSSEENKVIHNDNFVDKGNCQNETFKEEWQRKAKPHRVEDQSHQDYGITNPKVNQCLNDKDREAVIVDADDIVGEFDSGSRFGTGTFVCRPCSPANTCSLSSPRHLSSPRQSHEGNKADELLETTGSFSLNLSLSESPFDGDVFDEMSENCTEKPVEARAVVRSNGMEYCSDLGNSKSKESGGTHGFSSDGPNLKCLSKSKEQVYYSDQKGSFTRIKAKKADNKNQRLQGERPETPLTLESGKRILVVETPESAACSSSQVTLSNEATDSNAGSPVIDDPASPSCTFTSVTIIDVSANELLFHHFTKEWKARKEFSLALSCERVLDNVPKIGGRFNKRPLAEEKTSRGLKLEGTDEAVVGLAVCWGGRDAYYISLKECSDVTEVTGRVDESMVASNLTVSSRLEVIKSVLEYNGKRKGIKLCFDSTAHYKALAQCSGITLSGEVEDPKVAAWLLDPTAKEKSLHHLVAEHISDKTELLEGSGAGFGCGSLGLASQSPMGGRSRSSIEAVVTYWLMKHLRSNVKKFGLDEAFYQVEMPVMKCLARMELNGVGFCEVECERLKSILQGKLRSLEETAYKLANHSFSLTSPDDVATVLFLELKLPVDGKLEENNAMQIKRRTLGTTRRASTAKRGRKQLKHLSTNKEVLERLKPLHPLPGVILEWRRLNSALTKVVYPVQREKVCNPRVTMSRIYTTSQIHTATGRVAFAEPNLQNVPRDFDIDIPSNLQIPTQGAQSMNRQDDVTSCTFSVSMRNTFVPFEGGVMLAADYSQLELRLIAHLSVDERLLKLLNTGGDVFKMIAGSLNGVEPTVVTDVQRQQAKQICYGIIYGIGAKSLGEQLNVNEDDASAFIEKFKSRFKGIRRYLKTTVANCKKNGFVLTVTKRRRYLPGINSTNVHARSQAERQAVNTTVQGSAADLVKIAMINIDRKLTEMFPTCRTTHRHKIPDDDEVENTPRRRSSRISAQAPGKETSFQSTQGAFVVLQLHDELILEVTERDLGRVATMLKKEMETAMKLSVVLPVKLKAGPSWGAMTPLEL